MSTFTMKLPDVGEGVAEAEIVEWLVEVGDEVTPDSAIAEVLTDKATVEISAPVSGVVVERFGEPGDVLAVGSDLLRIDTGGDDGPAEDGAGRPPVEATEPPPDDAAADDAVADGRPTAAAGGAAEPAPADAAAPAPFPPPVAAAPGGHRPTASPAVRGRAKQLGIDLATVRGTGPSGRIVHADLDRLAGGRATGSMRRSADGTATPVRGVRRRIAQRLTDAWQQIPHITYVEAVDVTELERLRAELNREASGGDGATGEPSTDDPRGVRLTILPFLARAIALAAAEQPGVNAHYDHASETLTTFDAVHVGIATQTEDGLMVPVVRHVEARGIRDLAGEIARVTSAARSGSAARDELSGSTITITSLGALGGLVTTPILNPPEVAIVGVNKIEVRPIWIDGSFVPRSMMNLSSSFDHRMVDGWDAATFVQRLKRLLETPALLFVDDG